MKNKPLCTIIAFPFVFITLLFLIASSQTSADSNTTNTAVEVKPDNRLFIGEIDGYNVMIVILKDSLQIGVQSKVYLGDCDKPYYVKTVVTGSTSLEQYMKDGSWSSISCTYSSKGGGKKLRIFDRYGDKWQRVKGKYVDYRIVFFALGLIKEAMDAVHNDKREIPYKGHLVDISIP